MAVWLLKTEPTVYSYEDLERDRQTMWDGVTNNQALQNIRKMEKGDIAIIYHTGDERTAIGLADVVRGNYVNPEHDDPKLAVCDVRAKQRLPRPVTLAECKAHPDLQDWLLVRSSRLSVVPLNAQQWKIFRSLAQLKT